MSALNAKILAARAELLEPVLAGTSEADKQAIGALLKRALAKLTDNRDRARSICRFCEEEVCRPRGCPVEHAPGAARRIRRSRGDRLAGARRPLAGDVGRRLDRA